MLLHGPEVLLGFSSSARTQALVILDLPTRLCRMLFLPLLVLVLREERVDVGTLGALDDRRHELLHEAAAPEEVGPPEVEEVDEQALDVRPVEVLIRHDHHGAVPHLLLVSLLTEAEAEDLDNAHDLLVLGHLLLGDIPHVEQLPAQREHTVPVAPDHGEACHRQGLGAVPLRQDERTLAGVLAAGIVGVLQLRDTQHPLALRARLAHPVHLRGHLGLGLCDHG
mmetsp:Transcript_726/g.1936  ORF Transcript_726/g.1936 Transcript_726/m.1936 type:complete len:224 (+) Transcript_726:1936-2607(+)